MSREQVIRHVRFFGVNDRDPGYTLAYLRWQRSEPHVIRIAFGDSNVWYCDRDMLHAAAIDRVPAGLADLRWSELDAQRLRLDLSSPDGMVALAIDVVEVAEFLGDTYAVVPRGEESAHLDIDAAVAKLLSEEAR